MDETMDYVYHHAEHPNHGQLPYSQQRSRCPYFNRADAHGHPNAPPHRSTPHYDPVHASASHWQSQAQLPPHHWQSQMLGHRATSSPYHRPANSVPEPPYYNHAPVPNFGLAGYQGPPHDIGGIQAMHPPFPVPSLPPMRYSNPAPIQPNPPNANQPPMAPPDRGFGQPSGLRDNSHFGAYPPVVVNLPPSTSSTEGPSSPETSPPDFPSGPVQALPANPSIQFGSAPPSSAAQPNPAFTPSSYWPRRTASGGESFSNASNSALFPGSAHTRPAGSSTGSSSSPSIPVPVVPAVERRRVPALGRRGMRRPSPPPDRDPDQERELQILENFVLNPHGHPGRDFDDIQIRAAQVMRGSVTTKMVASNSAIQSLQSVAISDLSESERTCVICYNDFGVETPEGLKEAPLRLPKCKHVFGDHCIKKWFEESDSCPYCRDKVPSEPKVTSHMLSGLFRRSRERDYSQGLDELSRNLAAPIHGERRSPPTDGGESRRRVRSRHGSFRGPGSPPFSGGRPGSFGGSSSNGYERRAHPFAASRNHAPNTMSRAGAGVPPPVPFATGNINHYHASPSYVAHTESASSASIPPYAPPIHSVAAPPLNRNSLPAPAPGNWHNGSASTPDDTHRRMMLDDSNATPQAGGPTSWGPQ
ncbi:E3 ubiquitin-protein ligase RDUF2 [Colletotrichum siamense]|uniref:E3 ubiquitin-protein ligase RDUF2 n=1 Tax=Colletotrichum siamense TaxID=690259 RepID=UPI0018721F36|nr:E3 ubiquitin-protein ligase RDUF2 [Colletotrichum siamense]KAF5516407.1 E3 ubiquitin-protein ligase RDUF2 [Colletotrichum siamense]